MVSSLEEEEVALAHTAVQGSDQRLKHSHRDTPFPGNHRAQTGSFLNLALVRFDLALSGLFCFLILILEATF